VNINPSKIAFALVSPSYQHPHQHAHPHPRLAPASSGFRGTHYKYLLAQRNPQYLPSIQYVFLKLLTEILPQHAKASNSSS
jgi:hypothetical protein